MPTKIEISYRTIVFTVFFLIILWLLIEVSDIIFLVFVALILMSAFKPWVDYMEKRHVPRVLSVLIIYLILISLIVFIGTSIIPPLVAQSIHLGESLPDYLRSLLPFIKIDSQLISQQIAPFGENILKVTIGVFSNIVTIFSLIVISFYLLLERKYLEVHLSHFMGGEGARRIIQIINKVEERLGAWVRGQIMLALLIGLATFIGLTILGLPYVLPLSILAGILEIVPIIGPIIASIPAIVVALTISPLFALATAAVYFIIQQTEAHVVVPQVMKKAVGVPPLVTIIALMIGGKLAGILGALLAVPVVLVIETVITEYTSLKTPQ